LPGRRLPAVCYPAPLRTRSRLPEPEACAAAARHIGKCASFRHSLSSPLCPQPPLLVSAPPHEQQAGRCSKPPGLTRSTLPESNVSASHCRHDDRTSLLRFLVPRPALLSHISTGLLPTEQRVWLLGDWIFLPSRAPEEHQPVWEPRTLNQSILVDRARFCRQRQPCSRLAHGWRTRIRSPLPLLPTSRAAAYAAGRGPRRAE